MDIGGNINAVIELKNITGKNKIGESVETVQNVGNLLGWLDYSAGDNNIMQFNAKVQETTHIFLCDFNIWNTITQGKGVTEENIQLRINNHVYDVLLIDNVMNLNEHMEIYLKYVGGGIGGK